ncbi:hypothetical protein IV203_035830 [Nitzschia inconspicua]|uniref:Uncharacterized protein n=1 Tax=Nitzschia inconspicua TaxID=303405 RepID=A0A9K3PVD6_9STRA|nr:hypothetical protein IV203_035830 [Nitzschia inconspicua]
MFLVVLCFPFTIISLLSLFFLDFDVFNLMLCHVLVQTMRANCDYFAGDCVPCGFNALRRKRCNGLVDETIWKRTVIILPRYGVA